jgi:hypothetical protein
MSESQFEKMCKALAKAERERDLSRHTVEVQDGIINELRDEIERLRGLLKKCQPYVEGGGSMCDTRLCDAIEKEVGEDE